MKNRMVHNSCATGLFLKQRGKLKHRGEERVCVRERDRVRVRVSDRESMRERETE